VPHASAKSLIELFMGGKSRAVSMKGARISILRLRVAPTFNFAGDSNHLHSEQSQESGRSINPKLECAPRDLVRQMVIKQVTFSFREEVNLLPINIFTMPNQNNNNRVILNVQSIDYSIVTNANSTMTNKTIS
jgi:hypothetical protein